VRSQAITPKNVASVEWSDAYFKLCAFSGFAMEGQYVSSDFVDCSFQDLDWYWGLFTHSNFVGCRFQDCTFAGTGFPDTRFIDCRFTNCSFVKDEFGRECDLTKTLDYGCKLSDTNGFHPALPFEVG
jgi:uncharacterized protein YjbI with pentapeptide repeats